MARHDQTTAPDTNSIQFDQIVDAGQSLMGQAEAFVMTMFRTWNLYQVAIAIGRCCRDPSESARHPPFQRLG